MGRVKGPGPQAPPDAPLPQQVKSIERFLRRLEFHASKVHTQHACVHAVGAVGLGALGTWGRCLAPGV